MVIKQSPLNGLSGWELDRLYRVKSVQNTADTISTLTSLASLLSSLETIVVRDHITRLVDASLSCLESARGLLEREEIGEAALQTRKAIVLAERAFFDPTMVSLLYFPAQHLLAIYVSLEETYPFLTMSLDAILCADCHSHDICACKGIQDL